MSAITGFKAKHNVLLSEVNEILPTPQILRKNEYKQRFVVLNDEAHTGYDCWVKKDGDFFLILIEKNDDLLFQKLKLAEVKGVVMKEADAISFMKAVASTKKNFRDKILTAERDLLVLKRDFDLELSTISKLMPIKL